MKCGDFKVLIRTFTLLGLDTALPSTTAVVEEVVTEEERTLHNTFTLKSE